MRYKAKKKNNKKLILLISIIAILVLSAGATLAFITTQTDKVDNTFSASSVTCSVVEDDFTADSTEKTNVKVQNTGDTLAYIRAHIVFCWVDNDGNVSGTPVDASDYELTLGQNTGWTQSSDGYYYYSTAVSPSDLTGTLIASCKAASGAAPEGYHLSVEIIADAVQSSPADAVNEAWGVTVDANGAITAPGSAAGADGSSDADGGADASSGN